MPRAQPPRQPHMQESVLADEAQDRQVSPHGPHQVGHREEHHAATAGRGTEKGQGSGWFSVQSQFSKLNIFWCNSNSIQPNSLVKIQLIWSAINNLLFLGTCHCSLPIPQEHKLFQYFNENIQ